MQINMSFRAHENPYSQLPVNGCHPSAPVSHVKVRKCIFPSYFSIIGIESRPSCTPYPCQLATIKSHRNKQPYKEESKNENVHVWEAMGPKYTLPIAQLAKSRPPGILPSGRHTL